MNTITRHSLSNHLQVQRLVAVLSLAGVSKAALLDDKPLEVACLSPGERATLSAAGWVPGTGVRSLLNFNGGGSGLPHPLYVPVYKCAGNAML